MPNPKMAGRPAEAERAGLRSNSSGGGVASVADDGGNGAGVVSVMVTWMVTWCRFLL